MWIFESKLQAKLTTGGSTKAHILLIECLRSQTSCWKHCLLLDTVATLLSLHSFLMSIIAHVCTKIYLGLHNGQGGIHREHQVWFPST